MKVRPADPGDAAVLAELDRICFVGHNWKEDAWTEFLSMPQYGCYIIEEDDNREGFLLISMAADEGEILKIGVLPSERGKNLGTAMLEEACQTWRNSGVAHLFLEVRESNLSAQILYKKNGFVKAGIRKNYYKDPVEHAVIYTRDLEGD